MPATSFERINVFGSLRVVTTVTVGGTVPAVTVHTTFADTMESGLSTATSVKAPASPSITPVVQEAALEFLIGQAMALTTADVHQHVKQLSDTLAQLKFERLRRQLAEVENQIKTLLCQMAAKRSRENGDKEAANRAVDSGNAILENLHRAAEAYDEMLNAADFDP